MRDEKTIRDALKGWEANKEACMTPMARALCDVEIEVLKWVLNDSKPNNHSDPQGGDSE